LTAGPPAAYAFGVRPSLVLASLLLFAAALHPGPAAAEPGDGESFSVLSYNVRGLSDLTLADAGRARAAAIGWLANRYDAVLVQEDFEYHDLLVAQMAGKAVFRGNGMGWDPRRLAVKLVLAPFALLLPDFWPPYGSGLASMVREDLAKSRDFERTAFGVCNGWFGAHSDCWANKGFLRVAIEAGGAAVDLYNTHLDAGDSAQSVAVRRLQLDRIASAIEARGAQRPVVVAGDFNLAFSRPGDRETMHEFRRRLRLDDSGAGPEVPFWRERDFILYRSGAAAALHAERGGEALEFVNGKRALSDHPALYARFRVERRAVGSDGGRTLESAGERR
jgi:hypothetical protein